jgi:hypothetical protein
VRSGSGNIFLCSCLCSLLQHSPTHWHTPLAAVSQCLERDEHADRPWFIYSLCASTASRTPTAGFGVYCPKHVIPSWPWNARRERKWCSQSSGRPSARESRARTAIPHARSGRPCQDGMCGGGSGVTGSGGQGHQPGPRQSLSYASTSGGTPLQIYHPLDREKLTLWKNPEGGISLL